MKWHLATDEQLKVIIEAEGNCHPTLLAECLEEVVKRNLYEPYFHTILTNRFISISFAEKVLKNIVRRFKTNILYSRV